MVIWIITALLIGLIIGMKIDSESEQNYRDIIEGNEKLINMSKKYEGVNERNEPYFPSPYKKMWGTEKSSIKEISRGSRENRRGKMNKNIKELLNLINDNPGILEERKVIAMVDTEVVASDDYANWLGQISKVLVDEIYEGDERIYFLSKRGDIEELEQDLQEAIYYDWLEEHTQEELEEKEDEIEELARIKVEELGWEKVIILHIGV